ncbi:hypothetical protein MC885_004088, partial [Smutsia gigantea]
LLNLEKLLRQFLISKDTLSVRMLDDTRDPTPLLKEIRDDKTATVIIHANASMSHTILLKAAELGMVSAYYTYIFTNLEFSLQRMDSLVDDRVNILGFSIFNQSHAFFQEFAQSLNQSWQENCDHVPFTGPAVSTHQSPSLVPLLWTSPWGTRPLESRLLQSQPHPKRC